MKAKLNQSSDNKFVAHLNLKQIRYKINKITNRLLETTSNLEFRIIVRESHKDNKFMENLGHNNNNSNNNNNINNNHKNHNNNNNNNNNLNNSNNNNNNNNNHNNNSLTNNNSQINNLILLNNNNIEHLKIHRDHKIKIKIRNNIIKLIQDL